MKNKIIYFFIILSVSFSFTSCSDILDLEPAQSISETKSLESDASVKNVLRGAYDAHRHRDLYGGNILRNAELLAGEGEILWVGTFSGPRQIFNKQMFAANEDATGKWRRAYNTINITNNVLSALAIVNEADRNRVEGEALFLRSLCYFDLVRFYAKTYEAGQQNNQLGVPLVITPTRGVTDENFVSRNSVEEVYNKVITDLTRAASILPDQNGILPGKYAAEALLARVYLQKGDFPKARDAANNVIESKVFQLRPTYADVFNQDLPTSEDIYAVQFTSQDISSGLNQFFSIPAFGGRDGDIDILDGHLDLYDPADARLALFYEGNGGIRSGKWNNQFGTAPILRLADVLLIRAECNARLNTAIGASALDDYNTIRQRAGLTAATSVSVDDIIFERRLELAHEGQRIHDLKRLKANVGDRAYSDPKLVFPIPAREMEANKNLVQNEGY